MSDIGKAYLYAVAYIYYGVIMARNKSSDGALRILHVIDGFNGRSILGTTVLPVLILRIHHLDVGTVTEHYRAQVAGGISGKDLAPEASCIQKGKKSRVIDMCMGKEYIVDMCLRHREGNILKSIYSLLHSVIHKNVLAACFEKMAASSYFMRGSYKDKLHRLPPFT